MANNKLGKLVPATNRRKVAGLDTQNYFTIITKILIVTWSKRLHEEFSKQILISIRKHPNALGI